MSCLRERQGLPRAREKGSIQERLVLPVWGRPQKRDNKCKPQRRRENVTLIHLLQGTFDRQLFLWFYVHPLHPPIPAHVRGFFFFLKTYKIGITSDWMKQRFRLHLGREKYPLSIIWKTFLSLWEALTLVALVRSLGQEDPLEEGMATPSSIPACRIPRTEDPGGRQPIGSQRVSRTRLKQLSM